MLRGAWAMRGTSVHRLEHQVVLLGSISSQVRGRLFRLADVEALDLARS